MSHPSLLAARSLFEAGDLTAAADLARRVAAGPGRSPEALMLWGVAAAEAGDFVGAIKPLRQVVGRTGPSSDQGVLLRLQLGRALIGIGRWAEGLSILDVVEEASLTDPRLRLRLARGYLASGRIDRALFHLRGAGPSMTTDPGAQVDLAWALATLGQLEGAAEHYERAITLSPTLGRAHAGLATLRRWASDDNHIPRLRALFDGARDAQARAEMGYALFKELDDVGDRDEAWSVLEAAHAAAQEVDPWSPEADAALIEALIRRFPIGLFRKAGRTPPPAARGPRPIFVMGLPRTGTTLVERILSAHSRVVGLGELPFFPIAFREAVEASALSPFTPEVVRRSRNIHWRELGTAYLREAGSLAGEAEAFVDKLPFNSHLAGAIRLALPHAKLVLVERDPMDCLWSAYRNPFQVGGWYGWTRHQPDLATHYENHARLMDHWREALNEHLIVVRYERLVAEPETAIADLLDRCGLAPEPACFRPEAAEGAVQTLSQAAARAPISTNAAGAWRAYAERLETLRAALASGAKPRKPTAADRTDRRPF